MKKFLLLFVAAIAMCVSSCSKDKTPTVNNFSTDELEILSLMTGVFDGESKDSYYKNPHVWEFSPYNTPVVETLSDGKKLELHGEVKELENDIFNDDYYFFVDVDNNELVLYGGDISDDVCLVIKTDEFDYKLIDNDVFLLKPTWLQDRESNWITYTRRK